MGYGFSVANPPLSDPPRGSPAQQRYLPQELGDESEHVFRRLMESLSLRDALRREIAGVVPSLIQLSESLEANDRFLLVFNALTREFGRELDRETAEYLARAIMQMAVSAPRSGRRQVQPGEERWAVFGPRVGDRTFSSEVVAELPQMSESNQLPMAESPSQSSPVSASQVGSLGHFLSASAVVLALALGLFYAAWSRIDKVEVSVAAQVKDMRAELSDTRKEVSGLRNEISNMRAELVEVKTELRGVKELLAEVRDELKRRPTR